MNRQKAPTPHGQRDWIGPLAVALAAAGIWFGQWQSEQRAFVDMPTEERQGLYERTLENLRTVCQAAHGEEQRSFCRDQADLVMRLPECDAACLGLAQQHLAPPTR
jgi:hypothetical protein